MYWHRLMATFPAMIRIVLVTVIVGIVILLISIFLIPSFFFSPYLASATITTTPIIIVFTVIRWLKGARVVEQDN